MLSPDQIQHFHEEGYVIVEDAILPSLMEPLRQAARRITARTRSGNWPHKRGAAGGDVWGVQQVLHPDLGEPVFAEYMASAPVLEVTRDLLGPELRLGLVNLLVNPAKSDFAIGWHRDLFRREAPAAEEESALHLADGILQWNSALYEDSCLLIVPGSHRRVSTEQEKEVQFHRPMDPLPGEMVVHLEPGQGVYYNNMLIHRGIYPRDQERMTLHAALTTTQVGMPEIYYAGVQWMEIPGFRATLPEPLIPLYDNWSDFARASRT